MSVASINAGKSRAMIIALFALFFAAQSLLPAKAAEPIVSVPYRLDYDGLITIEVMVNDRGPYDFVIDTGSTLTLAFARLAAVENFQPANEAPKRILGISGSQTRPAYFLGKIDVGGATLENHVGIILDGFAPPRRTPDGIIGLDFMRGYALYFDNSERTMTLYPSGGIPQERIDRFKNVRMIPRNYAAASGELFTVKGRINEKFTMLIVDLGAAGTLINYEASSALFAGIVGRNSPEGFTTGSRLKDIFNDRTRARTALIPRIQVDKKISWRQKGVWIYDAPIFDEIGVQHRPYGLFGVDLLDDRDFALDFENRSFWIGPAR